ncbi:MAG: site-specific DNA-methyltransferase [Deltaproteobacteria bacterium]|nr:site-specific DNA-methyltransferase [Deltaproteobacteria bacterium]
MSLRIERAAAAGAPRLHWEGRPEGPLEVEPALLENNERWADRAANLSGRLILGDNLPAMAALEPGSVRLCYLDPPFFSGARYRHRIKLRDLSWEVDAFDDVWSGGLGEYLSFLEPRLRLIAHLLAEDGSVYLHLDASAAHYVKVLMDEIFGAEHFSRQIIWRIGWVSGFKTRAQNWVRNHDVILYYARPGAPFHKKLLPHPDGYERRGGGEGEGRPIEDVWTDLDSIQVKSFSAEKTGYATQKNVALLERIVEASSDPGDLVLDPFGGAGTTAVAAARLGREFVSIDALPLAIHQSRRRLIDEGVPFAVAGEIPERAGGLEAEAEWSLAGPVVRLLEVPGADGPREVSSLERLDAWWICERSSKTPIWFTHRPTGGRHPDPVTVESEPLTVRGGTPLRLTAVDLAGGHHLGKLEV